MLKDYLFVAYVEKRGRGVFTKEPIPAETVIEIAPVVAMPGADRLHLDKTLLHDYIFEWGDDHTDCAMALGWISIYNHSYTSNCEYFMDFEDHTILIKTVREIDPGEELTINYNGEWDNATPVWFEVHD